ncbi:MAG: molybdopterin-dependent oxidoreductase [Gammaproteobacteria bacterium]|nr:molybdopterin-dependent oxidoreductase [Gammaproteobacteria bacterium]
MTRKHTKTTCPYCGVGCGIEVIDQDGAITVRGDKSHPANYGRLCSKGASLHETLDLDGRLLEPRLHGEPVDWGEALDFVADGFRRIVDEYGPDAVAFYVSGQLLTEDYYVANKLMKGFIGSANIDTNSRLCMSSSVAGHKRAFGSDTVPCSYEDLELADLIVLTGSNTAWCHPVLFQRIRQAKKDNPDLYIVVIDPRRTDTCDIADLHLAIRPGSDAVLFNGLLRFLSVQKCVDQKFISAHTSGLDEALQAASSSTPDVESVARECGLSLVDLQQFYARFAQTEKSITVYSQGINQSSSGTDKVNAIINCHLFTGRIGKPGMGPFSFTGQPNAMGGREVGGLSNQLAVHLDIENSEHQQLAQTFWQSPRIARQSGLKAVDMFNVVERGQIKAIWIMSTNPVVSMPDADQVKRALEKCELVVVSDCMTSTDTTECADVLLPALAWGEKDGTVTNSERRISRQRQFLFAPGKAKPDWWAVQEVARRLGFVDAFNFASSLEIFREYARMTGYENRGQRDLDISLFEDLGQEAYDGLQPVQWPVNRAFPGGKQRMFHDGQFYTVDRRAKFIPIIPRSPVNHVGEAFPLVLNTGRIRDQWHTMTRSEKAPRLNEHTPEPFVMLHPADAIRFGLGKNGLARISSSWGQAVMRVRVDANQGEGSVFMPMHWSGQFASQARIGAVVNPAVDPVSGQPELKHTPVKVEAYQPLWFGFVLSRRKLDIKDVAYWVRARGKDYYRYELAGEQLQQDWSVWAREILCTADDGINWVEFADNRAKRYRAVRMEDGKLESVLFIGPDAQLPDRDWLASLFQFGELNSAQRAVLLTGRPPQGVQDTGRKICACFGVGKIQIVSAIKAGAVTVEQLGKQLQAGTNCGSCVPELKQLIKTQLDQSNIQTV